MVELDTGNARYLIRFTEILERQGGWAWGRAVLEGHFGILGCIKAFHDDLHVGQDSRRDRT